MGRRDGSRPHDDEFSSLLAAARAGRPDGYDGLAGSVERELVGFLRARGAEDAPGLANDVLVRAFRSLDRFQGGGAEFRSWVFAIARNRLVDERRYRARRVSAMPTSPHALPDDPSFDATDHIDADDRVEQLLGQLTDDQREVVLLRVIGGLSVGETAQVLGVRPGAVRALQHRGLATLRRKLSRRP